VELDQLELRQVEMPLITPFHTSFGVQRARRALIMKAITDVGIGWGECVAEVEPVYSSEFLASADLVIEHHLLPRLFAAGNALTASSTADLLSGVRGHFMAKAALEMAILDAELRSVGVSLAHRLGAGREAVDCGVSVGIESTIDELVLRVGTYLADGYRRVKLKIEPGWDLEPVAAVRAVYPDIALQVDANAAYTIDDAEHLGALDEFGLLLIEQPLADDDLLGHAALARRLSTPVCLDESITSTRVAVQAIELGACSIVNIKAGRVGGYLEAVRLHDACRERDVPVWCGGMLETGLGRAANLALAALPGFTLPGDTSASARYWAEDLTPPFVLHDGQLSVPTGPGIGVEPAPERLDAWTTARRVINRPR
jgi:o-succinylbenzoate synthase